MPQSTKGKAKKPPGPWGDLQPDVLENVASLLSQRDRFKLNLVCAGWRDGLANAGAAWAEVTVDPRRKASTSRRIRFNKQLPTPEAMDAWFQRYGRHVRQLHLRHLDAAAQQEGCVGVAEVAALLRAVAGGLRQLCFHQCTMQALLAQHAADLRGLLRLTSLHFQLPPGEGLSLGTPEAAFITCLTGLQDLGLATGYGGQAHALPASLAALPSLRSLQLARLAPPGEPAGVWATPGSLFCMRVASCLASLTALESLAIRDFFLQGEERQEAPASWLPRALLELPRLSSLHLSDVGLGRAPPPPRMHPTLATGIYPLPPGLAALAGRLREVVLLEHTCAPDELAVLSTLTGLTGLCLSSKHRRVVASTVPDSLSHLTGLAHLRISHGLTQVPPCITGLTCLTYLDLSWNKLRSLKPGPYLKRLVAVNLRANAFTHFPQQLRVARHTAQELQLPQNDSMEISERDVEQLLTFEQLRVLVLFGACEEKGTRRNLAALQKAMPWLLIDV
ncbi:hypothetical protein CHLNCDRAFT_144122 [Chlorella variabilis]|uniref:F-box domain-containing protein n=1 Tax=Chlorella variabilis TaxID=554065 RepID=E1ZBY7_CHLVA|nr:hypothetical protein CHLNCDRAFT_144122 [Chlorella variabilis]EFN56516.1 hypothetical protein CHLNCDRAFT_144122 [Chlorella variabilis]|eukprot:XP_005848618.1 hypothetical protein CHLNCDRAFT_144122 [Chlorella variabilis]